MFCKFCRSRNLIPVVVIQRFGSKTRTAYHCPNCGEEMSVVWTSKKKEKKND